MTHYNGLGDDDSDDDNQSFIVQYLRIFCALFCSVLHSFYPVLPLMPALRALIG